MVKAKLFNLLTFLNEVNIRQFIRVQIKNCQRLRQGNKYQFIIGSINLLQPAQMLQIQVGYFISAYFQFYESHFVVRKRDLLNFILT